MGGNLFGAMYAAERSAGDVLLAVAREFSPRISSPPIEMHGDPREILMDLSGLTRLFGDRHTIAAELRRTAAERGLQVRVALADSRTAARLLVHHRPGVTIVRAGDEAKAVGPLPVEALRIMCRSARDAAPARHQVASDDDPDALIQTLRRWGVRTLDAFAALPPADIAARLGQQAVRWQRVACGEDLEPLVPAIPEERFEQALDLEWPIEGLDPLSFVLGRLLEPLSAHLERRDRGAAVLHVHLHLVTRLVHERSLQLPVPMRDPRTLRTLLLLDLESHPPPAAIDRVVVAVDPTPGRIVQYSLLTRPLPTPEQLSTLMARLQALMGETRCGAPATVDSWEPGAFTMKPFAPRLAPDDSARAGHAKSEGHAPAVALRRLRMPVIARVVMDGGQPGRVTTDRRGIAGGRVVTCAGPWRTSGGWWADSAPRAAGARVPAPSRPGTRASWDRDEWDVALADGITYRIFRERDTKRWFIEGVVD